MPRRELSRERDDRLDVPAEAALRTIQRAVTEAAIRIEHGQHGDRDAARIRRGQDALGSSAGSAVRLPVTAVMQ
jgi:hypothetical protein